MGYPTYQDDEEWRGRALTAEQDLDIIRGDLRDFIQWLESPVRGPIIFRSEVVERLKAILAP